MTHEPLFGSDQERRAFIESLRTARLGKLIDHCQRTGSTNDLALQAARSGAPHGQVFCAEVQDAGRGRRGRKWECPAGLGLLFSVIVRPAALGPTAGSTTGWIPLVTGLACAEAIGSVCGVKLAAKWPNDVVLPCAAAPGWRKLGGILCESAVSAGHANRPPAPAFIVIGIGLNLNHSAASLPAQARTPPTSVLLERGKPCSRREVLRAALERLEEHLLELHDPAASSALKRRLEDQLRRWWSPHRMLAIVGQAVSQSDRLPACPATVHGRFQGLGEQGQLAIQDGHGRRLLFADAEVLSVN